jgi:hypothetical protein
MGAGQRNIAGPAPLVSREKTFLDRFAEDIDKDAAHRLRGLFSRLVEELLDARLGSLSSGSIAD